MDKEIKKLLQTASAVTVVLLAIILLCLSLISAYHFQNSSLFIYIISAVSLAAILLWLVALELIKAYKADSTENVSILALRAGNSLLLPAFIYLTGFFKGEKDGLRRIYISINNLVVKHKLQKNHSAEMLILLPHCMQNKDCNSRITEDIGNCRRCGSCKIGEVADITEGRGIRTVVAKGGTAARNAVKESRPDFILAVACERELVSGIGDVGKVPVIGVINQRPNGYCTNTTVDILKLKDTIQELNACSELRDKRGKAYEGLPEGTR